MEKDGAGDGRILTAGTISDETPPFPPVIAVEFHCAGIVLPVYAEVNS
jgi:hypothetical protein